MSAKFRAASVTEIVNAKHRRRTKAMLPMGLWIRREALADYPIIILRYYMIGKAAE